MFARRQDLISGISAIALAAGLSGTALAQEAAPQSPNGEGEFLGTLTLGESKREVQTDTAVPLTVIDQEEIDDRQANTIAELIDSVPGVTLVNGSTPSGSGINIRGFGANATFGTDQKVAVLVDGASTGAEELYRIGTQLFTDPYLYERVEVQRGTVGSFEYGSGIVGGIVRLDTIDASSLTGGEPGFKWAQTLGYASNGDQLSTSSTLAWQPAENLEFLANYSYREQDTQEDGNGDEIGNSAFELPSFLLKGRYRFGPEAAHAIEASFTQTETAERDVPYDTFITTGGVFGNVDRDITSQAAALTYIYAPFDNDLIEFEAALTYANQEIDSAYIPGSSPIERFAPGVLALGDADHRYETTKLTVKNASFVVTGPVEHELRYGFETFQRDRLDAYAAPGGTDTRHALFIVDDMRLLDGLTFTPALRYESSELNGRRGDGTEVAFENDALMGGASLRYAFGNGLALFTSYAYTESFPILDDLENPAFAQQPELANTFEAGLSFERAGVFAETDSLAFKANYYDTRLDDVTSYAGVDQIDLTGVELESSYAVASGFYVDLNANFVSGEEIQPSGTVVDWERAPQDSVRLTVGQRFGERLDLSAEIVSAFETMIDTGAASPIEADAFTVVNLRATLAPQEGALEGTEIRFGVENAFDEFYQPLLATRNAPGRSFKVTLSRVFF